MTGRLLSRLVRVAKAGPTPQEFLSGARRDWRSFRSCRVKIGQHAIIPLQKARAWRALGTCTDETFGSPRYLQTACSWRSHGTCWDARLPGSSSTPQRRR
ncbi:unnamed protein product [Symbiodinium pilosum]|uniref:Uncharacterized protein n=1 Tax=Symbiodinium pilosum TaxID=2952 RepID=A0A812MMD9_SYMPI|nr:unnamed protein product [Symbiodinium pilosum]